MSRPDAGAPPENPAEALRRLPGVGRTVRAVARNGRVERRPVAGQFLLDVGEIRLEGDRTGRSVRVHGAWLRIPAGWCPVHRDAQGPYVREPEAAPFVPLPDLFGQAARA